MSEPAASVLRGLIGTAKRAAIGALPDTVGALMRSLRPTVSAQTQSLAAGLADARNGVGEYRRATAFMRAVREPIDENLVVWETFGGNGVLCSPAALFREVVAAPDLANLSHVWMVRREIIEAKEGLLADFADHPRVRFVVYRSAEYFSLLESAKWLVNNATFPREFVKRPEQTYLNTWHGTPLKHMGYDEQNGSWVARNVMRNFLSADYLLSSSEYMTDRMYRKAYRLSPLFRGTIIEDGFPRTDVQFDNSNSGDTRTLLLAPTWRGASFQDAETDVAETLRIIDLLNSLPPLKGWNVRLKVHQAVYRSVKDDPRLSEYLVANSVPTNEILAETDLLVTDFSSIFMDALATRIPCVFYARDFDEYLEQRGVYVSPSEFPGPIARTVEELSEAVIQTLAISADGGVAQRYESARRRWVPHEDGGASRRLADVVFRGRREVARRVVRLEGDNSKTRIVIHIGGLKPNGISTSALNLLSQLDRDQYDITAVFPAVTEPERRAVQARIPSHVRVLPVENGLTRLPLAASYTRVLDLGTDLPRTGVLPDDELWKLEWRRIVGEACFDVAIDFSGYSAKWVRLMSQTGAARSLLWMHNDLLADSARVVGGEKPYERTLTAVFGMLSRYDALVSVSEPLRDINRANLSQYAPSSQFLSARNVIDAKSVMCGAGRGTSYVDSWPAAARAERGGARRPAHMTLDTTIDSLLRHYGVERVQRSVEAHELRNLINQRGGEGPVFCTVGRMSPEKNHDRLLHAFSRVLEIEADALLVIVGDGPLRPSLEATATRLGLTGSVLFTGQIPHPYGVLDESDCFILSSDYEGQPMVILEALTLGLPVITTAFGSASAALPAGIGQIVERDADALARAMIEWQGVPRGRFDVNAYNAEVLAEFSAVVSHPSML